MSVSERKAEADELYRKGQHDAAARAYGDALQLSEQLKDASLLHLLHANRAAAHLAMGNWQLALQDALKAAAVDDNYAKAHYRAAVALDKLGRPKDALRSAKHAAALDPTSPEATSLVRRLQQDAAKQAVAKAAAAGVGVAPAGSNTTTTNTTITSSSSSSSSKGRAGGQGLQQQCSGSLDGVLTKGAVMSLVPREMRPGTRFLPAPDGIDSNVLVMFHGLGDTPAPFASLAQVMALPQTACLALAGPMEVPEAQGGRCWFTSFDDSWHMIRPSPGEPRRIKSLAETVAALTPLLAALGGGDAAGAADGGGQQQQQPQQPPQQPQQPPQQQQQPQQQQRRRRRVHLFGFSQGGCVALEVARQLCSGNGGAAAAWLGSVVSISGSLLEEEMDQLDKEEQQQQASHVGDGQVGGQVEGQLAAAAAAAGGVKRRSLPVLMTHGDRDKTVPSTSIDRSADCMRSVGCDVSVYSVEGKGHSMLGASRPEAERLMVFYSRVLAARPPGSDVIEVDM